MKYFGRENGPSELNDQIQSYFDGEIGDAEAENEVKLAIESNPELAAEAESLGALRDQLKDLPQPSAPSYLRNRVISTMRDARMAKASARRPAYRSPVVWVWAAAATLIVTLSLNVLSQRGTGNPLEEFVSSHVALVQSEKAGLKVDDPERLEAWLEARLDFGLALPEWTWARPVSAEVSLVDGERAARIHYELEDSHEISLFVHAASPERKMESLGATSPESAIIQEVLGYKVACWGEQGLEYVLVADSENAAVLRNLSRAG